MSELFFAIDTMPGGWFEFAVVSLAWLVHKVTDLTHNALRASDE